MRPTKMYLYAFMIIEIYDYSTFALAKTRDYRGSIQMKIASWIPLNYSCGKNHCSIISKDNSNIKQHYYNSESFFYEENIQNDPEVYQVTNPILDNNHDYPWGKTAPFIKYGNICISYQYATNGMGYLVRYEKIRPAIYCDDINR